MNKIAQDLSETKNLDDALNHWRQGDVLLDVGWFVHIRDPKYSEIELEGDVDIAAVTTEAPGVVIISQSCDIVRPYLERPFIQVVPLLELSEDEVDAIKSRQRPRFAYVPAVADRNLVADLDRTMTIEKTLLANWGRIEGCRSEAEKKAFAEALARHKNRPALPDEFGPFARKLVRRLKDKRSRDSDEGKAVRALREVRITPSPDWDADDVTVFFWFVVDDPLPDINWGTTKETWLKCLAPSGRLHAFDGTIVTLSDMTADDYVHSSVWDLDRISPDDD